MAKPIGPICNLACEYCYYLDKKRQFPRRQRFRMRDDVLERFVREYIESQAGPEVSFAWQGGEPTLLGLPFFERVIELQQRYAGRKRISNALQTNGTRLDDDWCRFLHRHRFLVGISLDGPRELHDTYRYDQRGRGSWDRVMAGLALLKRHRVEHNILTVVQRRNAAHPLAVYRFLRDSGARFMQFIPLVERLVPPSHGARSTLAPPPGPDASQDGVVAGTQTAALAPQSVSAEQWGAFLCTIFDEWVRRDVGRVFVQQFDTALNQWLGLGSTLCVFAETCGRALVIEHDGGVYACDHYVYPRWRLGNIADASLAHLVELPEQRRFGEAKRATLPRRCLECTVRFACGGDCPRHRFVAPADGDHPLSYLCAGYRRFFRHIDAPMKRMAELVRSGRPAAEIMRPETRGARPHAPSPAAVKLGRNAACPCGSGRKFKHCCGGAAASA
ncbi:MAG: anaerobic sulfatase maturase [Burkholderiales bacterium]|nr:anaerobic sulfatase maturase [Burkholderiales bacterium]